MDWNKVDVGSCCVLTVCVCVAEDIDDFLSEISFVLPGEIHGVCEHFKSLDGGVSDNFAFDMEGDFSLNPYFHLFH